MTYLGQWSARRDLNSHSRLMELGPRPNAAAYYATCRFYATYLCTDGVANHPRFPLPLFNVPSHKLCISHSSLTASHVVRRDSLITYLGQWLFRARWYQARNSNPYVHLWTPDFKSGVSTVSTSLAYRIFYIIRSLSRLPHLNYQLFNVATITKELSDNLSLNLTNIL